MSLITLKDWRDAPDSSTPLSAIAVEDIEGRAEAGLQLLSSYLDRANGQTGIDFPTEGRTASAFTPVAQRGYLCRGVPSRNMTIVSLVLAVSTAAGADDSLDMGIYNASGTLIASTGPGARGVNTVGRKVVALTSSVALLAGVPYYVAFVAGAVTGSPVYGGHQAGSIYVLQRYGTGLPQIEGDAKALGAGTLPSSWGSPSPVTSGLITPTLVEA